jgi:hypothetical protein
MAEKTQHTAESARLFTFNEIGACLNAGQLSEKDASKILLERAKRKATKTSTPVPAAS